MVWQVGDGNQDDTLQVGRDAQPVVIGGAGATVTFFGGDPAAKQAAQTAALTDLSGPGSEPGTPDYEIQALINSSAWGFASQDEAETVVSVVLNLQTRVAELETKLVNLGLIASA